MIGSKPMGCPWLFCWFSLSEGQYRCLVPLSSLLPFVVQHVDKPIRGIVHVIPIVAGQFLSFCQLSNTSYRQHLRNEQLTILAMWNDDISFLIGWHNLHKLSISAKKSYQNTPKVRQGTSWTKNWQNLADFFKMENYFGPSTCSVLVTYIPVIQTLDGRRGSTRNWVENCG